MTTIGEPEAAPEYAPDEDEGRLGLVPRYFVDDADAVDEPAIHIRGPKARRLIRVMRVRRDDPLEIVHPPSERLYQVRVDWVSQETVTTLITESRELLPARHPKITISASLIRPQRYDFVIEKATELGVVAIRPVWSERSLVRGEGGQRLARWRRLATEAAEQCRRERRPEIASPVEVEEIMAAPPEPGTLRLLASALERSRRIAPILSEQPELPERVHLLVGPEGGFSPAEAKLARSNGWIPVTLGDRPLRAETASVVAIALVAEAAAALR